MSTNREREFRLWFIEKYRALPCLWDIHHKDYSKKFHRDAALNKLVSICQKVDPEIDMLFVRKRIANMRTTFRREYRRMERAKEMGDEYVTSLWYYSNMLFLKDSAAAADAISKNDMDIEEIGEDESIPESEPEPVKTLKVSCVSKSKERDDSRKNRRSLVSMQRQLLEQCFELLPTAKQDNDEYATLGRRVAEHFRSMDPMQRLLAEKLVFDVVINGRMKLLSTNSHFVFGMNPNAVPNTNFGGNTSTTIVGSSGTQEESQGENNTESCVTYNIKIE